MSWIVGIGSICDTLGMQCVSALHRRALVTVCLLLAGAAGCGGDDDPAGGDAGVPDAMPQPTALCTGPYWTTEGEAVTIDVLCPRAGDEVSGDEVTFAALPAGASYDAASARITWTPGLDQAAVWEITAEIADRGESATIAVGVADAWDHADNVPIVDRSKYPMEYGMPVFFLSPPPADPENYENIVIVYRGETHHGGGKLRGASSLEFPKNNYTLEFPKAAPFSEPERAGGFLDKHKIVLTSTFDDNSYVRQRLAFELWNRLDPGHVQVQSFMAVVYLEDEFRGLYMVVDHVDDDLMAQQGLGGDGNLYKTVSHDANFKLTRFEGGAKAALSEGYEKKSGDPEVGPDAFADLEQLIRFVNDASDATFAAEIGTRIDLGDYMDWLVLITFLAADDNAGKNTYHYHGVDGAWRMIPWDFNATSGQDWTTARRPVEDVGYYESYNRLFERFLAIDALRAELDQRYRAALDGVLSVPEVYELIDEILAGIDPAVLARDQARWRAEYESFERWNQRTDFTTHEEEVSYVRAWLAERWAILSALHGAGE
jgi:spore coat protein H